MICLDASRGHLLNFSHQKRFTMKVVSCLAYAGLLLAPALAFSQEVTRGDFNSHTYIVELATNGITWTAAEASAVGMGGHLASITSVAEESFVYSLASSSALLWPREGGDPNGPGIGPWLGGYQTTNGYAWSDGSIFSYSNFAAGEPNNYGGDEIGSCSCPTLAKSRARLERLPRRCNWRRHPPRGLTRTVMLSKSFRKQVPPAYFCSGWRSSSLAGGA